MEERSIKIGTNIGSPLNLGYVGGNVESDFTNSFNTHANEKNLAEAAAEIQQLLEQLEKSYSADTTSGKMAIATEAIQHIEKDLTLRQKIFSALKAGGLKAFEQALSHPAASFLVAALEDWQKKRD